MLEFKRNEFDRKEFGSCFKRLQVKKKDNFESGLIINQENKALFQTEIDVTQPKTQKTLKFKETG